MTTTIIQLSDLHIGEWLEFPPSGIEEGNLKRMTKHLCNSYPGENKPIVLITGDLINDGAPEQFLAAKALLQPLYDKGFMVWPVPGNHDYGEQGNHADKKRFVDFKKAFFGRDNLHFPMENVVYPQNKNLDGHWFIGLNSMKGELGFFDGWLADGELGTTQLKDTVGVLEQLAERTAEEKLQQKVILFLHHHPFIFPHIKANLLKNAAEKFAHYLKDGQKFMSKISGLVDILLFGHDHFHINFTGTPLCDYYKIPHILSCGKSTQVAKELQVDSTNMNVDPKEVGAAGLLAWKIEIENDGQVKISSLVV